MDNLEQEISDLRAQLSAIKQEQNDFIDTVKNKVMLKPIQTHKIASQDWDILEVGLSEPKGQGVERPKIHKMVHNNIQNRKWQLSKLKRKHTAPEPGSADCKLDCKQCAFATAFKGSLKSHNASVHETDKKFKCEQCGCAYPQKDHLKVHIEAVHKMGSKKLNCQKCPYETFSKASLKNHSNAVHVEVRMQGCEECGKAFAKKRSLKRHIESAHKI